MATDHVKVGDTLGKIVRVWDVLRTIRDDAGAGGVTIDGVARLKEEVNVTFDGAGATEDEKFVHREFLAFLRRWEQTMDGLIGDLIGSVYVIWALRLVRPEVDGTGVAADDVTRELRQRMFDDSKEVLQNVPTVSVAPAPNAKNVGDGTVVVSIIEPEESDSATNVPSEFVQSEKFRLQCIGDSFTGGQLPANELFDLQGDLHLNGPPVTVKGEIEGLNDNRITNHGFEVFTVPNAPDDWTIDSGVVGVNIGESSTAFRGSKALELVGDGATAVIELSQLEEDMAGFAASARLRPKRHYLLSVRMQTTTVATGTITFILKGTGYTAPPGGSIVVATPGTTGFTLYSAVILMDKTVPDADDFRLSIAFSGTPLVTEEVIIDDVILQEMVFWEDAALAVAVIPGLAAFVQGPPQPDFFEWQTANAEPALIETFMVKQTQRATLELKQEPDIHVPLPAAAVADADYLDSKAG